MATADLHITIDTAALAKRLMDVQAIVDVAAFWAEEAKRAQLRALDRFLRSGEERDALWKRWDGGTTIDVPQIVAWHWRRHLAEVDQHLDALAAVLQPDPAAFDCVADSLRVVAIPPLAVIGLTGCDARPRARFEDYRRHDAVMDYLSAHVAQLDWQPVTESELEAWRRLRSAEGAWSTWADHVPHPARVRHLHCNASLLSLAYSGLGRPSALWVAVTTDCVFLRGPVRAASASDRLRGAASVAVVLAVDSGSAVTWDADDGLYRLDGA